MHAEVSKNADSFTDTDTDTLSEASRECGMEINDINFLLF
jgi:hypothetical protein